MEPSLCPALGALPVEQVRAPARRPREHRDRLRGLLHANRRARRGTGEPRAAAGHDAAITRREQVFAAALKRVNARRGALRGKARRARHAAALQDARARKRAARRHHPGAGRSAGGGMRAKESALPTARTDPREIGRVCRFVRDAQARRDG